MVLSRNFIGWLALALAVGLGPHAWAETATCIPPPELKNALRLHPVADVYADLGNWYAGHQQFDCAIDAFQSARRLEPDSAHIDYLLGLSQSMAGHYAEAVEPLRLSVERDTGVLKPHIVLASVLSKLGRQSAAAEQWEAVLRLDPHSAVAQDGLCKALLAQRQADPVIALLSNVHLDEKLASDLAQAYSMEFRLNEATAVLRQALRTWPSSAPLVYGLVTVSVKQDHPEEGARVAAAFAAAHPHDLSAQKLYLRTLEFNGDPSVALPLATKLLTIAPHDPEVLYLGGIDECEAGRYELARKYLEEAVALDPAEYRDKYNVRYYLGTALFELNDFKAAKEQLEKAVETQSANGDEMKPQARWELAMALRNLGESQQAREQLAIYQQEKQALDDRTLAAQKTVTAADELARGNTQKAIDRYREAVAATPNDAGLNYKLALALDSTGDFASERTILERAVQIDPTFALAQYQLGYVESQQGDYPAAEQQFRLAVQDAPAYTKAWVSLAATLGMESRFPEAQQAVSHALQLAPNDAEALQLRSDLARANRN
jgi:tetratricopeptide (TPR) repeat protein